MFPFEKLEIYKKAVLLNQEIYRYIKTSKSIPDYFKNQLGRASLSVMLNIAEGSGRFSNKDRRHFFVISRSSAFECASIIQFLNQEGELENDKKEKLNNLLEEVSKVLYIMIKNLES